MDDKDWYTWGHIHGHRNLSGKFTNKYSSDHPGFKEGFVAGQKKWKEEQLISLLKRKN